MAYKAINEKFPPEVWEEINAVKERCGMTWAEFLPAAARTADIYIQAPDIITRLWKVDGTTTEERLKLLLDLWDECQIERDDGK